jgi:Leucine-rich repeat (LRR) protein
LTTLGENWEDIPFIDHLDCSFNHIETVVEENLAEVVNFYINDNNLTALDMSGCQFLSLLDCRNNQLVALNVRNGNNEFMNLLATNNQDLTCIEVDNVEQAEADWRDSVDPQATFSEDCGGAGFRVAVSPNPTMGKLSIESEGSTIDEVQIFDGLSGGLISREQGSDLDISHLRNGLYLLKIRSGENVTTTRIVKK